MYNNYFGFKEKPFTIAPNPRFLFMSTQHQEALAHMLYGLQGEGGVLVLTGEVGTGKTTICRNLLAKIPENTDVAFIINPRQSETEILASLCDELHIQCSNNTSIKALTDALNQYLLDTHAKGRHTVLIIDEAQNLEVAVLEQLRLLTNLETNDKKLLQIMLLGQPELVDMLARQELRQLAQRITSRYHLKPLNSAETAAYVNHRLNIAGSTQPTIFPKPVLDKLFQYSGGIPRLINLIADRALLGAYTLETKRVNKKILKQAKLEVLGESKNKSTRFAMFPYILLSVTLLATLWFWNQTQTPQSIVTTQSLTVQTTPKPVLDIPMPQAEQNQEKTTAKTEKNAPAPTPDIIQAKITPPVAIPNTPEENQAFTPIFQAWGIIYNATQDGNACDFAQQYQLACLRQRGDLASMRSLDRPAILTISNNQGQKVYTAVLKLSGTTATTATQNITAQTPLSQLALQSHNDFTLLWKTPHGYYAAIHPGHQGKLVALLATQVTKALNQSWIGTPRTKYDETLKEQVETLQRKEGLTPDGVAGPITWIHINRLNQAGSPSLQMRVQTH